MFCPTRNFFHSTLRNIGSGQIVPCVIALFFVLTRSLVKHLRPSAST